MAKSMPSPRPSPGEGEASSRPTIDAEILREALPYIRRFKGKTFVVKVSGKVTEDPGNLNSLAEEIALLHQVGIRVTAVHGGGAQATQLAERLGLETRLVNGRRVTDDDTLEVVKMVFAGKISVEILSALRAHGVHAVGVSGIDGNVVLARRRSKKRVINRETGKRETVDFGNVGDVVDVDPRLLTTLLDAGYLPVVSPLAADEEGRVFNVNADAIASALAIELAAEKLILLSDVPGVLLKAGDPGSLASRLTAAEARKLARSAAVTGGMVAKLEEISRVAESGVARGPHRQRQPEERPPVGDLRGPRQRHDGGRRVTRRAQTLLAAGIVQRLAEFVAIPTVSGQEGRLADRIAEICGEAGVPATRRGRNVLAARGEGSPCLLLNSHLDTVPPVEGWSADPWTPRVEGERLVGLGSNDAKASVAAMLEAFLAAPLPGRGRLLFAATCDEETGGEGLEKLVADLAFDAAIIGEPNGFAVAVSQKGLVKLKLTARGRAGHAARPHLADNAIVRAARDVSRDRRAGVPRRGPLAREADGGGHDDRGRNQVERRAGPLRADGGREDDRRLRQRRDDRGRARCRLLAGRDPLGAPEARAPATRPPGSRAPRSRRRERPGSRVSRA